MKECTHDMDFITNEDKIIGINLGWEFASEHEWGIGKLHNYFGISGKKPGFAGLVNTKAPESLYRYDFDNKSRGSGSVLVFEPNLSFVSPLEEKIKTIERLADCKLYHANEEGIAAAWSERDFGVRVPEEKAYVLDELYSAFRAKHGVIMLGGRDSWIGNSGLLLLNYPFIPYQVKKEFRDKDIAARAEQAMYRKLEEESGVIELLKAAGKNWNSLSVKRLDDKGEPLWWLNPYDQRNHKCGWYHTEDLKLWAEDKGPVMDKRN